MTVRTFEVPNKEDKHSDRERERDRERETDERQTETQDVFQHQDPHTQA